jgi:hypothetical protein
VLFIAFEGISGVSIRISPEDLEKRASQLAVLIAFYGSADPESVVSLLTSVATVVNHTSLHVDHPSANASPLHLILQRVLTDFAIVCVVRLARFLGYWIEIKEISHDEMLWALLDRDRERLAGILQQSLGIMQSVGGGRHEARRPLPRAFIESRRRLLGLSEAVFEHSALTRERAMELMGHPVMINYASVAEVRFLRRILGASFDALIDMTLDREIPKPKPAAKMARKLAAKSYSNLRSAAEVEDWSDDEVLRLIDEHLDPALSPRFAYYSNAVSGDDWRRIYRQLKSSGML